MTKRLKLKINNDKIKNSIIQHFETKDVEITQEGEADLVALFGSEDCEDCSNVINLHMSLLPAFQTKEALKESFLAGVKVGGITIHEVKKDNFYGRIIAQYPVLIGNDTHFDEYENELTKLGEKIYPIVIETILNDKVFDFSDLFSNKGHCSSCRGCHGCK